MGFRSMVVSSSYCVEWPTWFKEKHRYLLDQNGTLVSKFEFKTYSTPAGDLPQDIQKALKEVDIELLRGLGFTLIYLHECDGITKVQIMDDVIYYAKPLEWEMLQEGDMGHHYCYGCSDIEDIQDE